MADSPLSTPSESQIAAPQSPPQHGSILETLESIAIAFVLAFVFRAFVVEAFVIPTGSMAPTLLGQHLTITCDQCGYRFVTDTRDKYSTADAPVAYPVQGMRRDQQGQLVGRPLLIDCPMCEHQIERRSVRTSSGDRILVLKYIYALTEPRRWDVVVFKNPRKPAESYIKRLVGLPGEQVWIVDGNAYTRPLTREGAAADDSVPWQIQRKTTRPEVQRRLWQPVYRTDYFPLDGGEQRSNPWIMPWQPAGDNVASWQPQRGFRWAFEDPANNPGELHFEFFSDNDRHNYYVYNQYDSRRSYDDEGLNTIGEMRVAVTMTPRGPGGRVTLISGGRHLMVRARVDAEGNVGIDSAPRLSTPSPPGGEGGGEGESSTHWSATPIRGKVPPLPANRPTRLELWHVDQSVSLWVNGKLAAGPWEYDLADLGVELGQRDVPQPPPVAHIIVDGAPMLLSSLDLDRDLYYSQADSSPGRATYAGPALIAPDHFFCLGDNSPSSEDSRRWTDVDPWVTNVHDVPPGFVPRELMVGRAFFVYYPASHHLGTFPIGVPNFGDMRFIH